MQRRIFGIETEFGLNFSAASGRRLSPEEVARVLFKPVVAWGRSSNVFLDNAARLYLDVGSHPEYATAECDSVRQLIAQDRAGERIVMELAHAASSVLTAEGYDGQIYLFKNNVDSVGNSYGSHENYLIKRKLELHRLSTWLVPFLVTRPLIAGAGGYITQDGVSRYVLSPRAEHLWEPVSSSTTRSRPMINTRDEPHADAEHYRRLHVISGDSSMAEPTTLLKVGTAALVLRMLEAGEMLPDVAMPNPLRTLREVSLAGGEPVSIELSQGTTMTALDIQRMFHERASAFCEHHGSTEEEREILTLWDAVLGDLEGGTDGTLGVTVDWSIKRRLLEAYAARNCLEPGDPRLVQIDLAYHDIHETRGLAGILTRSGRINRVVSDDEIDAARTDAPETTRAALRGQFLKAARAADIPCTVDWMNLRINAHPDSQVMLKDPFNTDQGTIRPLLDALEQLRTPAS
jgi:proteasome accessory factor A